MPDMEIGGGGGGIGGIPTRYLIIGAGVLGVGVILMMQRGASTPAPNDSTQVSYGTSLGPNASLALGSLETEFRQAIGDTQQQLSDHFNDQTTTITGDYDSLTAQLLGLGTGLTTQVQAVGSQVLAGNARQDQIGRRSDELDADITARLNDLLGMPAPGQDWLEQIRAQRAAAH